MSDLLIKYLNEQLASESEFMFNYLYHSNIIENKQVKALFKAFSNKEFEHTSMLIELILKTGGEPELTAPQIKRENDLIKLLVYSIAVEEAAINKYTMIEQLIDDAKDKKVMQQAIETDKTHYRLLTEILDKIKNIYREENAGKKK